MRVRRRRSCKGGPLSASREERLGDGMPTARRYAVLDDHRERDVAGEADRPAVRAWGRLVPYRRCRSWRTPGRPGRRRAPTPCRRWPSGASGRGRRRGRPPAPAPSRRCPTPARPASDRRTTRARSCRPPRPSTAGWRGRGPGRWWRPPCRWPSFAGTSPVKASAPTVQSSPRPMGAAAAARASSASCDDRPTNAVLQDVAKSSANVAESPSAPPSKLERPAVDGGGGRAGHGIGRRHAGGQQRLGAHRLERRPRRVLPGHRAVRPRGRRVRHGENGSRRHRHCHQRRVALAAVGAERTRADDVGERGIGRLLRGRVERHHERRTGDGLDREQLGAGPGGVLEHGARPWRPACRRAARVLPLQPGQAGLVAGRHARPSLADRSPRSPARRCRGAPARPRSGERERRPGEHAPGRGWMVALTAS